MRGEHREGPTLATVASDMARVDWDLLMLKLAVKKVDFLIARDKRRWDKAVKKCREK